MKLQHIIIRHKKTQEYYHPKDRKWLKEEPKECFNSINKLYLDYDPKTKRNVSKTFKTVPLKDLEIIQRKYAILRETERNIDAEDIFQNRLNFQNYQNEFGYMLPDFIKYLHTKNLINNYKFIARLFNQDIRTTRNILAKLKHQGIKKTEVKFRNSLIALQDTNQLLMLKLTAGEYIYCYGELKPIYDVWLKMNLLT